MLWTGAFAATAQTTYSGYFLDSYNFRYQMNPAFGNDKHFIGFPALNNMNIAMRGNLDVQDVIYKLDGKTVLFTNPGISAAEVMKNIKDRNRIGVNTKIDLLSAGWKAWGGYNTVTVSAVANANVSVPGSFFELAKEGITNRTYDIENLFANANAYAQVALNHSRDISQVPGLRVGAAVKVYVGAGNVDFKFDKAQLTLGQDNWHAVTNANIYASLTNFRFDEKYNDDTKRNYVSGGDLDSFGLNGFGLGFDLGASYKWNDFTFSAAVLDLGFMAWGKTQWASTNGDQEINTDAFTFNADGDADNSFKNEWQNLRDDLSYLYQLSNNGELASRKRAMAATVNAGVDYAFPFYRPLHFGFLSSTRINGPYTWTQARISADVKPVYWFSAGINAVAGTYGCGFGWLANFCTPHFNLFLGMDHTFSRLAKQGVPLRSNADFNFGINFPF